jgi:PAS domain S-box-containing protein
LQGRLEQILREAPIGICITDENGYFEDVNPAYCRFYGYSREELIGAHFTIVVPEEHREEMTELHDRFMGRTYELSGEWEVRHRDGSRLSILANAAYIIDEEGAPRKVTFVVNLTDRKHYERELHRTVTALEREIEERKKLEEARDRAERMVRHDLKNPLNGILGAAQLLREGVDEEEEQRELIGMIIDGGSRLDSMLEGMFDYMKMEDGRYALEPRRFELDSLLRSLQTGMNDLLKRRSVRLELKIDGREQNRHEPFFMYGEPEHIQTMLENLLRNAVEASPEGAAVTFRVETGSTVRFDIYNRGVIPEELRESFFQRYTTSGKKNGSGLGTYVARLICELHGGSIRFTTVEAEGTHLYLELPAQQRRDGESES